MAKVKYYAKENSSIGTHSFYAVPIPNGTLTATSIRICNPTTALQMPIFSATGLQIPPSGTGANKRSLNRLRIERIERIKH